MASDTPLTDALIRRHTQETAAGKSTPSEQVLELIEHTRQLERELAAAQRRVAELEGVARKGIEAIQSIPGDISVPAGAELAICDFMQSARALLGDK